MNKEIRIEHYLLQLDRELQMLPVSQRAEIITEIKSHIRDSEAKYESEPAHGIDQILQDLGSPRVVAERYLSAKGLKPMTKSRPRSVIKWLAIGTVAFFGAICFLGMATIWYFSPLIKVDEQNGRVVLFGGLIDVNEKIGKVKVGDLVFNDMENDVVVKGEMKLEGDVREIRIPFNTAKIDLVVSPDRKVIWDCKAASHASPQIGTDAGVFTINLDKLSIAKCAISVPKGLSTEIRGVNGHMDIDSPAGPVDVALDNGKVNIKPDPSRVYDFEIKVKNGLEDFFPRSSSKDAVKVKVSVVNGLVKKK